MNVLELQYQQLLHEIIQKILDAKKETSKKEPFLVAIGGPGGTGKSTLAHFLHKSLESSSILHLDDYKTPRSERYQNNIYGAHPSANHMDWIVQDLRDLKKNKSIKKPIYCNQAGKIDGKETILPEAIMIVDGEISTYDQLRKQFDFSIFIDTHWKNQLHSRLSRDIAERNYTPLKAISTFCYSNLHEFEKFGAHTKSKCDLILWSDRNHNLSITSPKV
jgi:uridine kinase